jgi:uncharacterized protein YndB with AHSA1/START domain
MPDIFHDFPIKATPHRVYEAISTPQGLDAWWTKRSAGAATEGSEWQLWFGPKFDWRARVTRAAAQAEFELQLTTADPDWIGTRVGFHIQPAAAGSQVKFFHTGWPTPNEHWRVSCYCWAMYLRILRRWVEHGETVPYEQRLDV